MKNLIFSVAEYKARVSRTQKLLKKNDIDALLITSETNYFYYSGHRHHAPWSTYSRPIFLIIPQEGEPISLVHKFVHADAAYCSWIPNIVYHDNLIEAPIKMVKQLLKEIKYENNTIGAELGYEQRLGLSYNDFELLKNNLPSINFVDASNIIWEVRMIKSLQEIEFHQKACDATTESFRHVWPLIKAGMTERDVESLLVQEMIKAGAERPGFVIMTSGPEHYKRISGRPTNRVLKAGDMVWIDLSARYFDYWSDFCRGGVIGPITEEQKYYNSVIEQVTQAGLDAVKAGITAASVVEKCNEKMKQLGFSFSFEAGRLGHGIGLLSTEPPHLASYDQTVLQEGMVLTIEPGIVNEHGVFCLEENFVVTKTGYELLTHAERDLYEIKTK